MPTAAICTEHTAGERCHKPARFTINWQEHIAPGHLQSTSRIYCTDHGEAKIEELSKRGVSAYKGSIR